MKLYSDYTPIRETCEQDNGVFCSVCGKQISSYEEQYSYGNESVCSDESCMDAFYENNADEMLVDFAKEMGLITEATKWFYENI